MRKAGAFVKSPYLKFYKFWFFLGLFQTSKTNKIFDGISKIL